MIATWHSHLSVLLLSLLCFLLCVPAQAQICGDAVLEVGESCDDGNTANGDGCSSICSIESELSAEFIEARINEVCGCEQADEVVEQDEGEDSDASLGLGQCIRVLAKLRLSLSVMHKLGIVDQAMDGRQLSKDAKAACHEARKLGKKSNKASKRAKLGKGKGKQQQDD